MALKILCADGTQQELSADTILKILSADGTQQLLSLSTVETATHPFLVAASDADQGIKDIASYICDGTADEVQINAAIAALPAAGGTVFLSEGTFNIAASIELTDNTVLRGSGWATILYLVNGANTTIVVNSDQVGGNVNIGIESLKLDGNLANNNPAKCIFLSEVDRFWVVNCWVYSGRYTGAFQLDEATQGLVSGCLINEIQDGLYCTDCQYVAVVNNVIYGTTYSYNGLKFGSSDDCLIAHNYVECGSNTAGNCIEIDNTSYSIQVLGNYLTHGGNDKGYSGIELDNVFGCVVDGNIIKECGGPLSGNHTGDGIHVFGNDAGRGRHIISNNRISECYRYGICIEDGQNNCVVTGNICRNNNDNNAANISGIHIEDTTDCVITGNRCYDDQGTKTQDYGIYEAGTADYNQIADNNVRGNADGGIVQAGANSVIRNNIGHVTENSGTSTITSGTTSVAVAHGLSVTPTVDDISITLAEDPTNTPGAIWVDTIGAANFTVNCENDPGASNLDFGWRAVVL